MGTAVYDAFADWYDAYVTDAENQHYERVRALLTALLGAGEGLCLDVCCGTGAHAGHLRNLGWTPVGLDVSTGQLRHARGRLPVAVADATVLPVRGGAVPVALLTHAHTDLDDYPATVREIARVVRPGGRFVHVGVHPCFTGAFADRSDPARVVLSEGYHATERRFDGWSPHGVRARTGARHLPLAALLNAVLDAGLVLETVREAGPDGAYPDLLGFAARKPATVAGAD